MEGSEGREGRKKGEEDVEEDNEEEKGKEGEGEEREGKEEDGQEEAGEYKRVESTLWTEAGDVMVDGRRDEWVG